jgi:hypothetical protein
MPWPVSVVSVPPPLPLVRQQQFSLALGEATQLIAEWAPVP